MIVKRLKNLWKLGILISVRQLVFLGKNLYNLYYRPYLTIKKIREDGDKSQTLLICLTALTPIMFYLILRTIYDLWKYGKIIVITGNIFLAAIVIQMVLLGYLAYWTLMVVKRG